MIPSILVFSINLPPKFTLGWESTQIQLHMIVPLLGSTGSKLSFYVILIK